MWLLQIMLQLPNVCLNKKLCDFFCVDKSNNKKKLTDYNASKIIYALKILKDFINYRQNKDSANKVFT